MDDELVHTSADCKLISENQALAYYMIHSIDLLGR